MSSRYEILLKRLKDILKNVLLKIKLIIIKKWENYLAKEYSAIERDIK